MKILSNHVPFGRKCQYYNWVDDEIPKHYRIKLHQLKAQADQMELNAVRNRLDAVRAQLVNAETELVIERQLRALENAAAAAEIEGLQGQVANLTGVVGAMRVKMKKGVMWFVAGFVLMGAVGVGVGNYMAQIRRGGQVHMLMGNVG